MGGMMMGGQQEHPEVAEGEVLPEAPLAMGARGPGVTQLQHALIGLGLMNESAIRYRAGVYGPRTSSAIAELQQALGQEVSGEFDEKVRAHLLVLNSPLEEEPSPEPAPTKEQPEMPVEMPPVP